MIRHEIGNLFSVQSGYIVHGCNAQGVMGGGVAAIIKMVYPSAFGMYKACVDIKRTKGDNPLGSNTYVLQPPNNLVIVNAITQEFYGRDKKLYTSYDAVRSCFKDLKEEIEKYPKIYANVPRIINFPLIGCGLGGGDWEIVSAIIDEELDDSFEKVLWTLE